jgi:DNA-directed RNA polymerase subunit RPC12/RpoP
VFLLSDDLEEHWESDVARDFPRCPLCGSKSLKYDVEYGSVQDYIYCLECKAKWAIDWKEGGDFKVEYLTLLEAGNSGKYSNLIGEKYSPESWLERRLETEEGEPITKAGAVRKVRCEYCGTFFNEELDACPNCGGRITDSQVLQGL